MSTSRRYASELPSPGKAFAEPLACGQSRCGSLIESVANIVVGFAVALVSQLVILPLYGIHIPIATDLKIVCWFTLVSLVRSYCLRRLFNRTLDRCRSLVGGGPQHVPAGWKLVPDWKIGMHALFQGAEHMIYAHGDRIGTFDLRRADNTGPYLVNVPPDLLTPLAGVPA